MSSIGWLGRLSRGLALETFAPRRIFSLRRSGWVRGLYGRLEVRPLEPTISLGAVSLASARPAIVTALDRFARAAAYESWLVREGESALTEATCRGDDVPQAAAISLDDLLP